MEEVDTHGRPKLVLRLAEDGRSQPFVLDTEGITSLRDALAAHLPEKSARPAAGSTVEAGADRWEDIATAPKDGTKVDLWCVSFAGRERRTPNIFWNTKAENFQNETGSLVVKLEGSDLRPTHWRHVPLSPQEEGQPTRPPSEQAMAVRKLLDAFSALEKLPGDAMLHATPEWTRLVQAFDNPLLENAATSPVTTLGELVALRKVLAAARLIHNLQNRAEGMVIDSRAVRELWAAIRAHDRIMGIPEVFRLVAGPAPSAEPGPAQDKTALLDAGNILAEAACPLLKEEGRRPDLIRAAIRNWQRVAQVMQA